MPHSRSPRKPTPVLVRGVRLTRTVVHVFQGLATTAFIFPFAGHGSRNRMVQRWSRRLLRILSVEFEHTGLQAGFPERVLIVANHISWLDIFVLNALQPSRFIAKSDVKRWPVIGLLVGSVGTLFVDRTRRRDAARISAQIERALAAGDVIALFPEGTTTAGRELLPFHGSLLQPVIAAEGHVLPAAIRYTHIDGDHSDAPAYVGDMSLVASFGQLLRARRTRVRLHLGVPFATAGRHRREVAAEARRFIHTALELPEDGTESGIPGGGPAGAR
jgi:1-acyl-sn-glycerol-3-phosphate acyltransferase